MPKAVLLLLDQNTRDRLEEIRWCGFLYSPDAANAAVALDYCTAI